MCLEKEVCQNPASKACVTNYGPIALISNFSKIYDKIVSIRLYKFLSTHSIIQKINIVFVKE